MRKFNKDRVTSIIVIVIALVLIAILASAGCTQGTSKQFTSYCQDNKLDRVMVDSGLTVNKVHQSYMTSRAEQGQYHYVPEGAQVCWSGITSTRIQNNPSNRTSIQGITYAVWQAGKATQVQLISIKSL